MWDLIYIKLCVVLISCRFTYNITMFSKILVRTVRDKVGASKVIEAFKESYDYVIGKLSLYIFGIFHCVSKF